MSHLYYTKNKVMKHKKIIFLGFLVMCISLFTVLSMSQIQADVGNSFSGGGSSGGSSSSSGGGSLSGLFFLTRSPFGLAVLVLFFIFFIISKRKQSANQGGNNFSDPGIRPNYAIDENLVVQNIKEKDPDFSADNFKTFASEVWLTLQEAWESKSWQKVRPFESNALFNVHNRQLQEYIDRKKTNFMEMQNIRNVCIARYRSDGDYEIVSVKLDASLLDYVVDDESGRILEGSKTQHVHRSYILEFIRKNGLKTVESEGTSVTNCPNCGAPTEVTSSGQCEFCKSIITKGDYGWVLNTYAPWQ